MGAALTRGSSQSVIACAKHFALNSMENGRFTVDVKVAQDVLHECYLPHFRQCLDEGGAESLMSAYNSANGEWCGQNGELLNGVVRDIWGYEDVVITSDWVFGMRDAAKSVKAGLDIEMPFRSIRYKHLLKALRAGKASWDDIERLGKRVLRFELKYYSRIAHLPSPDVNVVRSQQHRDLAKDSAAKGMVLLKNHDSLLPLGNHVKKLLVVGSLAASTQTGDMGSSAVRDPDVTSPLEGLRKLKGITVTYLDGSNLPAVEKAASESDAVFLLVGFTAHDEGEYLATLDPQLLATGFTPIFPHVAVAMGFNWLLRKVGPILNAFLPEGTFVAGGDRQSLRLNARDEQLASAIADFAGHKLILGVEASGLVVLPAHIRTQARSILFTGYAGSRFGDALREVLVGEAEPAGRLAFTIPESELDIPDIDMSATSVTYDRFWGYRLAQRRQKRPAYPFGYGLGYSQVSFQSQVPGKISTRFFNINVNVVNVGTNKTSGVVQVYAGRAERGENDYERVLVGSARSSTLDINKSEDVEVDCRLDPVSHWNGRTNEFEVEGGKYNIWVSQFEGDSAEPVSVQVPAIKWGVKKV
jgi:beta-glucosidase